MGEPSKAAHVWTEMPFMRGPKGAERLREWSVTQAEIKTQCAKRKARVLAHEWAAKKLCLVFGYDRAEQWNGYVPPAHTAEGDRNSSQRRTALIELLNEVAAFDGEGVHDAAE